ncbi:hypothetical protein D3C73_617450 [compost metagenome]
MEPFDFQTFYASEQKFAIGTTDAFTGEPIYYMKDDLKEQTLPIIQASSSLPFVAQPVLFQGKTLFDGGLVDPIPIQRSIADGNQRHVIILTKESGYRKKPFKQRWFAKSIYPKYEGLVNVLVNRSEIYNSTLEIVDQLEKEGKAFVIRPTFLVQVGRMEKNPLKLEALYEQGYADAERISKRFKDWLIGTKKSIHS